MLKLKDLTGGAAQEKVVKLSTPQENNPAGEAKIIIQLLAVAEAAAFQEHVVYEFQRWQPSYSSTSWAGEHLLPSDPGMWCSGDGAHFGKNRELVAPDVPTGWEVTSSWHTVTSDGDPEGWQYASDFKSPYWYTSYSSGTCKPPRVALRAIGANRAHRLGAAQVLAQRDPKDSSRSARTQHHQQSAGSGVCWWHWDGWRGCSRGGGGEARAEAAAGYRAAERVAERMM